MTLLPGIPSRALVASGPPRVGLVAVVLVVACLALDASAQRAPDEYRLKAAFLLKLVEFVDWPEHAFAGRDTLDVCVLPPDPFGRALDELAKDTALSGRRVVIRRVRADQVANCHVAFAPTTMVDRRSTLLRLRATSVLTVGDAASFLDDGGVVQLRVVGNRVRFEVGLGAAQHAGLRVSPQLLRLAMRVREDK